VENLIAVVIQIYYMSFLVLLNFAIPVYMAVFFHFRAQQELIRVHEKIHLS